jgi:ABC-type transporter Mla subunit MlaD
MIMALLMVFGVIGLAALAGAVAWALGWQDTDTQHGAVPRAGTMKCEGENE